MMRSHRACSWEAASSVALTEPSSSASDQTDCSQAPKGRIRGVVQPVAPPNHAGKSRTRERVRARRRFAVNTAAPRSISGSKSSIMRSGRGRDTTTVSHWAAYLPQAVHFKSYYREYDAGVHDGSGEIIRDFAAVLEKVRQGAEVVVEQDRQPVAVISRVKGPGRLIDECIAVGESARVRRGAG